VSRAGAILFATATFLLAAAAAVRAQDEAQVRAANQLRGYYDTKVKESVIDNRLDVDLGYKTVSAGIVFLSHTPSDYHSLDPNKYGSHREGIRKRWVNLTHGPFELRLGDSYATFGSGLALRILEDQAVEFDNVVDGLHFVATPSVFTIEAIAGTNHLNLDVNDLRTTVKGLSARVEPRGGMLFGVNGAVIDSLKGTEPYPGRDVVVGVQGSGTVPGGIDLNAEYAIQRHNTETRRRNPAEGHGAYASARGSFGPVALTVEGKDLLRFAHAFSIPPTAARQHTSTLLNRGSHVRYIRLDDERGIQTEALYSISSDVMLTGNWSRTEARHATLPSSELLGQAEVTWADAHWLGYVGQTKEKIPEGLDRTLFERITFGGDWSRGFGAGWALEAGYETQGTHQLDLATASYRLPTVYRDNVATITVSKSPVHSWAATYEWSNDPTATRDSWLWLEWNIRLGLLGQLTVGGGRMRGGQVCSGGVCRLVDPFEGGRVELLANF